MILSVFILIMMIPSGDGNYVVAEADEVLFDDKLVNIAPGEEWMRFENRTFERGLKMYGEMRLDQNVHFFISDVEGYEEWVANGTSYSTQYDFPYVGELDIFYRHDVTDKLYFVMFNNNTSWATGSLYITIDNTGPVVTHNINEEVFYEGTVEIDFSVEDAHFRVKNASIEILGINVWNTSYTSSTAIPKITGQYSLDTTDEDYAHFENNFMYVYFLCSDEGNNTSSVNARIYIDNYAFSRVPRGGEFTWFSALTFIGMIGIIAIPVVGIKWGYNKYKPTKASKEAKDIKLYRKQRREKRIRKGRAPR